MTEAVNGSLNGATSRLEASDFLGQPVTQDYVPQAYSSYFWSMQRSPPFTSYSITQMLLDPRINFGLWLIKGPIESYGRFYVDVATEPETPTPGGLKEFLIDNITRYWMHSITSTLKCVEWGYSCCEALYKPRNGRIYFDNVRDLYPLDLKAITRRGELVAASVKRVPAKGKVILSGPRMLWNVHGHSHHPFYGRSRLFGAYLPWYEIWTDGGFRDCRRLYYHKYAYSGGVFYYPPRMQSGMTLDGGQPVMISGKDIAREMGDKMKSGGTLFFPNTQSQPGVYDWVYEPPNISPPPEALNEHGYELKEEELEGMGIPPEIAKAEGTGAYAGRKVPMQAFFCGLQNILLRNITEFDRCCLRPLATYGCKMGWFPGTRFPEYEIRPYNLLEELAKAEEAGGAGGPNGSQPFGQPGGEMEGEEDEMGGDPRNQKRRSPAGSKGAGGRNGPGDNQ